MKIKSVLPFVGFFLLILGFLIMGIKQFAYLENKHNFNLEAVNANYNYNIYNGLSNISSEKPHRINYIAKIIIPKISLEQGLVDINSSLNHVDKNIQILNGSEMPNVVNGNMILAAHSGNSDTSYFKKLNRLAVGDSVYIRYDNKQYEYKMFNYYIVEKTGFVDIIRNKDKTTLTLITCVRNTNKQIVVICQLHKITNLV